MAQSETVSREQVLSLIDQCFRDLRGETDAQGRFSLVANELIDQKRLVDERLADLHEQLQLGDFEAGIKAKATDLLHRYGRSLSDTPSALQQDLFEGIARALAEQARYYEFRLRERLLPYQPSDAYFRRDDISIPQVAVAQAPATTNADVGPTVSEAVDAYLRSKRKSWVPKTWENRQRQLSLLVEHLGGGRRLNSVTTADMRSFREGCCG